MPLGIFAFFATLAVISALGVILQRSPVHSLLALIVTLLCVAALMIGLDALAVGLLQAIVYVGAIVVLFLFVIWLLNLERDPEESGRLGIKLLAAVGAAALVGELTAFLTRTHMSQQTVNSDYGSMAQLAGLIFGNYLIAFEVTSLLLLVAVVGVVAVARRWPSPRLANRPPTLSAKPQT